MGESKHPLDITFVNYHQKNIVNMWKQIDQTVGLYIATTK